ncbi:TIGR03364 family FAD-dependent oxidoreductase [Fuerstiella marisgermanici]|uniref:D-amino acid dehydrogenase small subunit n=1 Tax=Fuerstiella marisgermanici TaxID=1891926 RepID=A0A1P8WJV2_9PLAN|nr:TIGR03364 family FAD-dependent oxidoreductase [Fuerstiella marisgermanici]APZ94331.1 D-amino acid dehydrogenase small subunit [Fuerstiella marisgermanici]
MPNHKFNVAIVGAGIVGLAHAWASVRQGRSVILFDRSPKAQGATVRNFGMIWPIGQLAGELYDTALRSRELWLELHKAGVVHADDCGSVHLAHRADERAVLEEFVAGKTHDCQMLSADETLQKVPIANSDGLLGGMWSPTELRVDPRVAASKIASWLQSAHGVKLHFETPIVHVDGGTLTSADGAQWHAEQTVICSGSDLKTLFPEVLAASRLKLCKLQMLRTVAQNSSANQAAHIASGLTLRHYSSFNHCPSLASLKQRVANENPTLDRYGIHVMATQSASAEFILGDSHEYGDDIEPFDKAEIDNLILQELRKIIRLPDWTISERWHGVYAKHPDLPVFRATPQPGVHVCVGPGGAGMTMSFGLAEATLT